ncbi:hypothetical protein [Phormidium sp. CCY1219]|uniref:hypothetical protein n=1 Tax=Phormidium sp. CCY1219 TaxID=2886104 RepID=UPI002D1EDE88|nr:hypothetical protein [Phormidium sp. CCY1219]MEB3828769.1 hypothetical protein [Phormidium sp. CCY1219]
MLVISYIKKLAPLATDGWKYGLFWRGDRQAAEPEMAVGAIANSLHSGDPVSRSRDTPSSAMYLT